MPTNRGLKVITGFITLMLIGLFVVRSQAFSCWDFRNNLWGPAYLLTHQQSPYRVDLLFELSNAVWMPPSIGLFFPLGYLPLQQASNLWFVFNLVWLLLIVWISSGSQRPPVVWFAVAIITSLLFPPMVTHLWSGQITILITLAFLVAAIWNEELHPLFLGALIAIGLSKPQMAILVVPGLFIHEIKHHGLKKAVRLGVATVLCMLTMTIPLFMGYPEWIPDFISGLQQNPSWAHPSSLQFLKNALPGIGQFIWVSLALMLFSINIWLWIKLPARRAVYWSLAFTTLVTPYIWTWDFVMLFPLFISSLFQAKTKSSMTILLTGYAVCWSFITSFKMRGEVNESLFWWVPWLLMIFIVGSTLISWPFNSVRMHARSQNQE
jgi:hypothetical protein